MKYLPLIGSTALLLLAATTHASIISTTGTVVVISPPADVTTGVLQSDTQIRIFPELQNIILNKSITVDITMPCTSPTGNSTNFSSGSIPVDTVVSSFYMHFDCVRSDPNNAVLASGSVSFDTDILGLIVTGANLGNSDAYPALPTVIYGNDAIRGLEIVPGGVGQANNDQIIFSADRRTVTFNLRDGASSDDVRIITAAVPEPASLSLLALPGALLLMWRRRQRLTIPVTQ